MSDNDRSNLTMCPNTDYFELYSDKVGTRFAIWVTTPPLYKFEDEHYPVMYLTDGNANGPLTTAVSYSLMTDPEQPIKPYLQVSVGYIGEEAKNNQITRARDLVPPNEPFPPQLVAHVQSRVDAGMQSTQQMEEFLNNVKNGCADKFLNFFELELHSEILKRYRAEPLGAALFGHSYGGLFSLFALVSNSKLFETYCAASPGISTENSVVYSMYETLVRSVQGSSLRKRKLHMVINELETTGPSENYRALGREFLRFIDLLRTEPMPNLVLTTALIPGENHMSGVIDAYRSFVRTCYT